MGGGKSGGSDFESAAPPSCCMPARPFTPSEISLLESRLLAQGRLRDRMLLIAGTNAGYRITELLTWPVGQVLTREGEVAREVTVTRAHLKGGTGSTAATGARLLTGADHSAPRPAAPDAHVTPVLMHRVLRNKEGQSRIRLCPA
jgi:hypothetical protein